MEPFAEAWRRSNAAALTSAGPLWVVLGDSTAQGIGASSFDRGWVGQLHDLIATDEQQWRILNLSLSGGRVRDVLDDQLPQLARLRLEVELVTVAVGANDIRPGRRAALAPSLEVLLSVLPEQAVVATIPGRPKIVRPFNDLIRRRASERRLRVADTADAIEPPWRGKLASDYFHPNDAGYAYWARAFARSLRAAE